MSEWFFGPSADEPVLSAAPFRAEAPGIEVHAEPEAEPGGIEIEAGL